MNLFKKLEIQIDMEICISLSISSERNVWNIFVAVKMGVKYVHYILQISNSVACYIYTSTTTILKES